MERLQLSHRHISFLHLHTLSVEYFSYLCFYKSNLLIMQEQGYIAKDLCFDQDARQKLINGITAISKAVKSTLGPRGKTVLIESTSHTGGLTITKDGVTVAKAIDLYDPVENLAVRMMKEAATKTATVAGDGTTTAIVLTEALVTSGMEHMSTEANSTEVISYLRSKTTSIVESLTKMSRKVTDAMLLDVATISANSDKTLGKIIAGAYKDVGKDGIVTVERSQNGNTYAEVTNGIKVDRGYSSPLFINNHKKDECILEDVKILVCDSEINNIMQLETVLKDVINNNDTLLIIGTCSGNMVNTLAANVVKNGLKFCNVPPPNFGYKQHELMQDIALAVGATYFSEKTGDDLSLVLSKDLGHAERVVIGRDSSVIVTGKVIGDDITTRVSELREQQDITRGKADREFINTRIASLAGGIGCIYVGGDSDIEQKEKFDRVDDSVCAVRSALQEGILPGGGLALWNLAPVLQDSYDDDNEEIADRILRDALRAPLIQILTNAGKDAYSVMGEEDLIDSTHGYDAKNERYGDMFEMGVIDPLKVTKNALVNASSVATTILSTNAIITHARAL
jgi:chaperonin GroEL